MDQADIDALVQRLVADPHDEEALNYAHDQGTTDPKAYASLLEQVGNGTRDPAIAAHWLSEAANVWSTTLGDAHRAARVLMMAIDKDPTAQVPAERLAQLYRDKGDVKALVALLDRRAKALAPLAQNQPELRGELAGMHEEMGRLWNDPPLSQPKKAIDNFKKAVELDPQSAYAIYNVRELLKSQGQLEDAVQYYQLELAIEPDPTRKIALLRDEAATRKAIGDLEGVTRVLSQARDLDSNDAALAQEWASSVIERIQSGHTVGPQERTHAVQLLVGLAEQYDGEHGLAYAGAALDVDGGNDRALQLFSHYARTLGREADLHPRYLGYVQTNPNGAMAPEARNALAASYEANGQFADAIAMLEPLMATGDPQAVAKVQALYPLASGQQPSKPPLASQPPPAHSQPPQNAPGLTLVTSSSSSLSQPPGVAGSLSQSDSFRRPQLSPDKLQGVLDAAQMLAGKGKKPEALAKYREVLDADPAHPEALAWVEDYLRMKRDYPQLRDVLQAAVRVTNTPDAVETRKERLREIAGLCEGQLRDVDGAIASWRQLLALDRTDESARAALTRLLEKTQRWDDLASLLEQEANVESNLETKIALEKKLARLQEDKRKDLLGAAEAWARIARLAPEDDQATMTASKLYEKAERLDLAAQIIAESAPNAEDPIVRGALLERLAELRETLGDGLGAADAYADAADVQRSPKMWEHAERLYTAVERWEKAASAAIQRAHMTTDPKQQAAHFARAAELYTKVSDDANALQCLEQATDLDPISDEYAGLLTDRYQRASQIDSLVHFLSKRGDRLLDRVKRVGIRRQAATLCSAQLGDKELARELWLKVLEDGDDKEALEKLIDDAVEREDHTEAATLLRRLGASAVDKAEKARVALREAELLAEGVGDVETALSRYELVLEELDPTCRPALQAIADLQEARDNLPAAADALERELKLVADAQERGQIAARLARIYEKLDDAASAIRALEIVRKADLEDFDALTRLCELCEKVERWDRVAELLVQRIEVEADEAEVSAMTRKLAQILADKLDRGDEALAALTELADSGDAGIRQAYVELGDRLGWKGIVATKLCDWWFEAKHGPERTAALRGAFDRFAEVGRDADAARVAIELIRIKAGSKELAERLEDLALKTSDHDALSIAHDLLARETSGAQRAHELVRQAEVRVRAGMPRSEALQHGEAGLTSISPADAEPLLERLAALAAKPADVIDLYERQVSRAKAPNDRVRALARVAQVSAQRGQLDRARGFFELALTGTPTEETLTVLEHAAREGDRIIGMGGGGEKLRRALCAAMASGGHGARDAGKTRGALLRRAASMAHKDLNDIDQAFVWLGEALVAHVDGLTLDALEGLGLEVGDPSRAEAALTHALSEVFDGPLVRQLLARRAKIRRDQLVDRVNAAADLKKLHDLSPNDQAVLDELSGLLTDLGDYRGLVQLYEDQILRGKDPSARAELARKVARMWEEQLQDAREAADAWRRVLRMKAGDEEATAGLERAKSNMLKKPDPSAPKDQYAPPKIVAPPPRESKEPPKRESAPPPSKRSGPPQPPLPMRSPLPPPPGSGPKVGAPPLAPPPQVRQPGSSAMSSPAAMSVAVPPPHVDGALPSTQSGEQSSANSPPPTVIGPPPTMAAAPGSDRKEPPIEETGRMELDEEIARSLDALGGGPVQRESERPRGLVFRSDEVTMSTLSQPLTSGEESKRESAQPQTTERTERPPSTVDAEEIGARSPMTVPQDLSSSDVVINIEDSVHDVSSLDVESTHASVTLTSDQVSDRHPAAERDATAKSPSGLELLEQTLAQPADEDDKVEAVDDDEIVIADDLAEMVDPEEVQDARQAKGPEDTQVARQDPREPKERRS
jgi:tetratricopeptide (TPR) repeat protein